MRRIKGARIFSPRHTLRSFNLDPHRVLTAVGQSSAQEPDARAHAGGFGVEIEVPLVTGEPELVAGGRRLCRRGINRRVAGGLVAVLDGLEGVNAREHKRTGARSLELHRDGALEFKRLQWVGETSTAPVRPAQRRQKADELEGRARCVHGDRERTGSLIAGSVVSRALDGGCSGRKNRALRRIARDVNARAAVVG